MRLQNACLLLGLALPAHADFNFPDFSNPSGIQLNGTASFSSGRLRVCPTVPSAEGSAWYTTPQDVASPWTTEFTFEMTGGADGMAFVIQGESTSALGGNGGSLGYDGIPNSVAIEFDVYQNVGSGDPDANHVAIHTNGTAVNTSDASSLLAYGRTAPTLGNATVHTARIEYFPGLLRVFVNDMTYPVVQTKLDLNALLNLSGGDAWVGFTAATGGVWQNHYVDSWSFDEASSVWTGNAPPERPSINEPQTEGEILNPFDVHMETSAMLDPNGDGHASSDFQIYLLNPLERVWEGHGLTGLESVHAHLGDGTFVGSHAGQFELKEQDNYILRMRHYDDSGDPLTSAGPWVEIGFQTGAAGDFYPLDVDDLLVNPAPLWVETAGGASVDLPSSGTAASLHLDTGLGSAMMDIEGQAGSGNLVQDYPALAAHEPLRIRIEAGSNPLNLSETDLTVVDHECITHKLLLPSMNLPVGGDLYLWVTSDGSTWYGNAGQTEPDFSTSARSAALSWVATRSELKVEVVASGLTLPVNIAFPANPGTTANEPFCYVTELYGNIKVVRGDGSVTTYASGLLNFNPTGAFPGSGEQGVTGLAVDPVTGDLFATMLFDQGGPHYPKVVRFSSADGGLTAATETTILSMAGESMGQSHQISHTEIRADGTLLVHMGDGFNSGTGQNLSSYRGKILRMNLDGSPATDNPFYNAGNGIDSRDYVWAYGLRNPFGGRTREADGLHYFVENGPSVDRICQVTPGHNFGWDGTNTSMFQDALYNWAPAHGPVNMAFLQPGTQGGSGFPSNYMDRMYISESGPTYAPGPQSRGKRLVEFLLDASGNITGGPNTIVEYGGSGRSTAVGLAAGPDGLYFTSLYADQGGNPTATGAQLLRVSYDSGQGGDCSELGTIYCSPNSANSTGQPGEIHAHGSNEVADDDLHLEAHQLPLNKFGYFLVSMSQGFVINAGGSDGNLCLGGTIGRFNSQVQNSGATGEFDLPVDLGNLPTGLGAVQPGDTWHFQCWYRDNNPASTSNFTDAVSIDFH